MFDELETYTEYGHFFMTAKDMLMEKCNAPSDKAGVYLVYALKNGHVDLVYIGRSGRVDKDGQIVIRKAGLGGIKDRIINGHHFDGSSGRTAWTDKIKREKLEALDICWYITHGRKYVDSPQLIKDRLLKRYSDLYGKLPRWNK